MKSIVLLLPLLAALFFPLTSDAAPLRVLVVSDSSSFSEPYVSALKAGGAQVVVARTPEDEILKHADVILLHQEKFAALPSPAQSAISDFAQRGGGIVAVNGAIAAGNPDWGKKTFGGAWNETDSRRFSSKMMLYVVSDSHPIVKDSSPFDIEDETYYDLDLSEKIFVLGSAFTPKARGAGRGDGPQVPGRDVRANIYDLQPQMWTFESDRHRAAVILQGAPATLAHASIRSFILRAVAWTGKRDHADEFCRKADLATLRYPAGGPLRAADSIKRFKMQPGFVAHVVAAEPLINKPIAVQWDGKGRLWVAETPEYPNGRRQAVAPRWMETGVLEYGRYDRPARDSISVLEDSNGDGQMDKKRVFFEGLELVTGFCLWRDGVIAVAQPHIVWLRDTDGDGTAETQTPLFGGFAPGDTHFVANHFIAAPDGWIYASSGSGAEATDPRSGKILAKLSPGMFRFRPDGSAIQQVASQGGNSFGGEVTSRMELFHGKATSGNPIQHVVLPEWVLAKAPNTRAQSFASVNPGRQISGGNLSNRAPIMQVDQVGRFSAGCSTAVYEGGAWPKEYDGRIFTSEPILDIIHCEGLKPNGPTYSGELVLQHQEWLQSTDYWFCPIDVSFGPDGAMYILDFNTPVVTHNDTRGPEHSQSNASVRPDRDSYFGRIYRVQHQSASKFAIPDLDRANAAGLVAAFKHPNKVVRFNAIRILLESADKHRDEAIPPLTRMATSESFVPGRILALWALSRWNALTEPTLETALQASDAAVRTNAMLIAEEGGWVLNGRQASAGIEDSDPRVKLATLRALGGSAMSAEAGKVLIESQTKFLDDWTKAAAAAASARNPSSQLEQTLTSANTDQTADSVRALVSTLAASGTQDQLVRALEAAAKSPHPALVIAMLDELGKSPPRAPANLSAALAALRLMSASPNRSLAAATLPLVAAWDKSGVLGEMAAQIVNEQRTLARDTKLPSSARLAASRLLLSARGMNPSIKPDLLALLTQDASDDFGGGLITALSATGEPDVGRAIADRYPALSKTQQAAAFTALASRAEWANVLLDAIEAKKIPTASFEPAQISRLTAHPDEAIAKRARSVLGVVTGGKDQLVAKLLPEIEKPANIANGKTMFAAACSACHKLEGAGNLFGPDLGGIGSHPVLELLTHIVNPNLVVDDEHRTWNITMRDGTQYSALIASENTSRVQIRLPGGVTHDLKPEEIASRKKGDNSLMPEGLEALGHENLRDIIGYIQSCAPTTAPNPDRGK